MTQVPQLSNAFRKPLISEEKIDKSPMKRKISHQKKVFTYWFYVCVTSAKLSWFIIEYEWSLLDQRFFHVQYSVSNRLLRSSFNFSLSNQLVYGSIQINVFTIHDVIAQFALLELNRFNIDPVHCWHQKQDNAVNNMFEQVDLSGKFITIHSFSAKALDKYFRYR